MKAKILSVLYFLCVGCIIFYVWNFAQNQYQSKAHFSVTQEETAKEVTSGLLGLLSSGTQSNSDTQLLVGYINSADLLIELEKEFELHKHYSSPVDDFYFRLDKEAQLEERLDFYRKHIIADFNVTTGLTEISATSFEPKLSQKILDYILLKSEDFINRMNTTIAAEKLEFVQGELAKSEAKVDGIKKEIADFQNKNGIISPVPIIQDQLAKMNELENLKIQKQIEIDATAAKSPLNPGLEKLRNEVEILSEQIKLINERMTGEKGQKLSAILTNFTDLNRELEFALSLKQTTEALLEQTRVDAISHTRFFTTVQSPYYPEEAVHPNKEKLTITIVICSILIFSIVSALTRSMFDRM